MTTQSTVTVSDARASSALLDAIDAAVYTTDADGYVTFYNRAAARFWGFEPEIGKQQWCGSWKLYWPDGRPMQHSECPMAIAIHEGRVVRGGEAIAERPDGTRVPFIPFPTPFFDESGKLIGALNMLVDITDRKQAEEMRELLTRELNHRIKNIFSVVSGIASLTARGRPEVKPFASDFLNRINALARAHEYIYVGAHSAPTPDSSQTVQGLARSLLTHTLSRTEIGSRLTARTLRSARNRSWRWRSSCTKRRPTP